ncbi:hypothetical protein PHK61_29225 [Actinomycetospora lutea]|uniref:hypothetical protein n=1 Tax=Actinomycetospora lutea TaxID=663604 RepID=UPI002367142A|nr:hypothetical protein [Actinomycetospora lutea]MDD7942503.1 hypothetical protein [Actinomycetospora lutea]
MPAVESPVGRDAATAPDNTRARAFDGGPFIPNTTSNGSDHGSVAQQVDVPWPTPDPTVPLEQLTDRELIARAEYCDEVAHTGTPVDRVSALRELDAAWDEAEHRAAHHPPASLPAQVAGYIGLVREDYDHALAAETATWRNQLDAVLPPAERVLDAPSDQLVPPALDLAAEQAPAVGKPDGRGLADWDSAAAIAERDGHVALDPTVPGGFRALTADERQVLVDDARPSGSGAWNADQHVAYLDSRPDAASGQGMLYDPAAEYGDAGWREPASDEEAAARTAYVRDSFPSAPGWSPRPLTQVEDAIEDAAERAVLSYRAHDHDPRAWAEYERLLALDSLAPLPDERDALDDLHADGDHDRLVAPRTAEHPEVDGTRGRSGFAACELDAASPDETEAEQRRAQLNRWHDDDVRREALGIRAEVGDLRD